MRLPVVSTGSRLVQCLGDGHTVEAVLVVVSLVQLLTDLTDVGGDHHKVAVGEANQNVAVTIPSVGGRGGRGYEVTLVSVIYRIALPKACVCINTSGRRRCRHSGAGRPALWGCRGR